MLHLDIPLPPVLSEPAVPAPLNFSVDVPNDVLVGLPDAPIPPVVENVDPLPSARSVDVPNDVLVGLPDAPIPPVVENVDPLPSARSRGEPHSGSVSAFANDRDAAAEGAVDRCLFQVLGDIRDDTSFAHGVHWEKQELCAHDFLRDWSPEVRLLACAACGYRHLATSSRQFVEVPIEDDKLVPLRYTEEDEADFQKKSDVYKRLKSSYLFGNQRFHLHPELVNASDPNASPLVLLCPTCNTALPKSVPRIAIAAGVDFGNSRRLNLPQLSLVEKCLLARHRVYAVVIKIGGFSSDRLMGHCIAIPHDGPDVSIKSLQDAIDRVCFI